MAQALDIGVLPWSPLRGGQLSGKYVRDNGTPTDSRRTRLIGGPTETDWTVIEAVARVAAELGAGSAEVALAWVRSRPAVSSTLIGSPHDRTAAVQSGLARDHPRARAARRPQRAVDAVAQLPSRRHRRDEPDVRLRRGDRGRRRAPGVAAAARQLSPLLSPRHGPRPHENPANPVPGATRESSVTDDDVGR